MTEGRLRNVGDDVFQASGVGAVKDWKPAAAAVLDGGRDALPGHDGARESPQAGESGKVASCADPACQRLAWVVHAGADGEERCGFREGQR